jgi:hypothetical protein
MKRASRTAWVLGFAVGTFLVGVTPAAATAPGNDNFDNPYLLGTTDAELTTPVYNESTAGATAETNEPYHAGLAPLHSVWYVWTPPPAAVGPTDIVACGQGYPPPLVDTRIAIYTGNAVGALTPVASNDDTASDAALHACYWGKGAVVTFTPQANLTYRIAVDDHNDSVGSGPFGLQRLPWAPLPPDTGPACQDADGKTVDCASLDHGVDTEALAAARKKCKKKFRGAKRKKCMKRAKANAIY